MNLQTPQRSRAPQALRTTRTARRLTVFAGWAMVAIAVLHTLAIAVHPYWAEWFAGGLRGSDPDPLSLATFWALPGGFVPVLALLGLLTVRLGRRGERLPGYVGWVLLAWVVTAIALIGPSGFLFGIVPAVALIASSVLGRRDRVPDHHAQVAALR
ncbi:DUF6463 family protein [Occultella gossypii]|uniref:Uncharacterized protein n=1 Tax=Occultella gossypii TaxID=2800820 RepID=A0ABS7SG88_9MICO|nr:DUF6463 family protein [Occultella gossypii]MBZ2198745.1 hypothetical protein [Occultella gossypii]